MAAIACYPIQKKTPEKRRPYILSKVQFDPINNFSKRQPSYHFKAEELGKNQT